MRVELPPAEESWACPHTQLAGQASAADAGYVIAASPNTALSRLLCPRRLVGGVLYTAFLVPAFDTGRLAGLTSPGPGVPALRPRRVAAQVGLLVYYLWSFTTVRWELARRARADGPPRRRGVRQAPGPGRAAGVRPGALSVSTSTLELEARWYPGTSLARAIPTRRLAPPLPRRWSRWWITGRASRWPELGGLPLDLGSRRRPTASGTPTSTDCPM